MQAYARLLMRLCMLYLFVMRLSILCILLKMKWRSTGRAWLTTANAHVEDYARAN